MNLIDLKDNESAIITNIKLKGIKKRRLYDMGFINNEIVQRVYSSIFNNPVCYKIKNTYVALRNEDAYYIEVKYE